MVSAISPPFSILSSQRFSLRNATFSACKPRAQANRPLTPPPIAVPSGRRQLLFFLTASAGLTVKQAPSFAEDIPLFGIRKNLKRAEEQAEEIVREGFEAADKGLETAERGLETAERGLEAAEKGIETAEREIESAVSFGGLAQAGVVAGAEFLGVLIGTAVVNGILGPEAQKS